MSEMYDPTWPAPTPRDELLARVVTRGRRIQMINRLIVAVVVAAVVSAAAVGVALGTSGTVSVFGEQSAALAEPGRGVEYFACPGAGPLGQLRGDDRVLVTGRDATGEWVELRSPATVDGRIWVARGAVELDEGSELPERSCAVTELALEGEGVVATTTTAPLEPLDPEDEPDDGTTTTTAAPGPGPDTPTTQPGTDPPAPNPPATTPTTTPPSPPPADQADPVISAPQRSRPDIRGTGGGEFCTPTETTSEVSVAVSDAGPVSVTLRWSFVGQFGTLSGEKPMSFVGGRWSATLGPFPSGTIGGGMIRDANWSVRAVDASGNDAVFSSGPNSAVMVHGC